MIETKLKILKRIEAETKDWLQSNGYNPLVAQIHLESIHLQNKVLSVEAYKQVLNAYNSGSEDK